MIVTYTVPAGASRALPVFFKTPGAGRSATLTAMARQMSLPSDPEQLLQFMDDMDSDFSDDDSEGYIDEDEWLEETMRRRMDVQGDVTVSSTVCVNGDGGECNVDTLESMESGGEGARMSGDWECDGLEVDGGESGRGDEGDEMESEGGRENGDSDGKMLRLLKIVEDSQSLLRKLE